MKRSSLRQQLIAWNTLTLAVLLGILGLATHFFAFSYAIRSLDNELAGRIHPPPGRRPPPPDGAPGGPRDFDHDGPRFRDPDDRDGPRDGPEGPFGGPGGRGPDEMGPRMFTLDGKSLRPRDNSLPWDPTVLSKAAADSPTFTTTDFQGEPYRVATQRMQPRDADDPDGVLQIGYPLADLNRATNALDRGLLALIPIGAIGAWIGATFLTRRVLGRVSKFTHAAEQMGEHDLSRRLPADGNDEFADLALTFNGLFARLEEAFQRQAGALEQQRRFTADASHELKTPLTVIKGTTSMALGASATDKNSTSAFQAIDHAADDMVKLVQDLLYLARADAGALGSGRSEILAVEVLEQATAAVSHIQGGAVQLGEIDATATLYGNEQELIRMVTNLLSNARSHTPPDGHVTVSTRTEDTHTELIIADDGCGIAAEHLPKLGQRFFRADESRSRDQGGTGLGLAIVTEIVHAHGGAIQFASELGKGATVTVTLPSRLEPNSP